MDFFAETEKGKQEHFAAIGKLAYRRQAITVQIERLQEEAEDLDGVIARHEAAVQELERVQRNFNTYLAVKEGALTTEQVAEAIRAGANGADPVPVSGNDNPAAAQPERTVVDDHGQPVDLAARKFNTHSCATGAHQEEKSNA